jgi:hypothetical protein
MKQEYLPNEKIGNLIFIQEDFSERELTGFQRIRKAVFQCECGRKFIAAIPRVKLGKVTSCGCKRINSAIKRLTRHGMSESSEYSSWASMKSRCYSKSNRWYKNYGGRGIEVCEEWKNSFISFLRDMGNKPDDSYSIERIDVNGNYEPKNCKWANRFEQDRNKTTNIFITYNNVTKIITDWAKEYNMYPQTLKERYLKYNDFEKAINF